jgi:hypothetical protein
MGKTHLVVPDQHAAPGFHNDRADWLGQLIKDIKPDVLINIGDAADMSSLSSYDKGKAQFHGRNYEKDINAHLDFQERMMSPMRRSKKKQPYRVFLEGNHEFRIKRAIDISPELEGDRFGMSFRDLDLDKHYHEVVEYDGNTPGIYSIDGVFYAHYFVTGVMGRPVSGEHQAYSLLTKKFNSCTMGHTHTFDYKVRTLPDGRKLYGVVCGVYQDYRSPWAGTVNNLWDRGVLVKRNVQNGMYDIEWISINRLEKEYG